MPNQQGASHCNSDLEGDPYRDSHRNQSSNQTSNATSDSKTIPTKGDNLANAPLSAKSYDPLSSDSTGSTLSIAERSASTSPASKSSILKLSTSQPPTSEPMSQPTSKSSTSEPMSELLTSESTLEPNSPILDFLSPNKAKISASQPQSLTTTHSKSLFWAELKWLLALTALGAGIGWCLGSLAWGIVAGLLLFYAWRSYAMQQFYKWLKQSSSLPPPDFSGSLSFVAHQLYASKRKEQLTHQRIMGLIKKIRSSLLALQDAVILLDKDDSLEWWNQAAEKLMQLRSKDQGRSILELIDIAQFHEYYANAVSPNEGVRFQSWRDPERYLQCEITHFGEEKLLIIYDVTRLQHLEQMRKDFVGNVSHELRTPLTVLMGYIETFSDQPDLDPKWQRGFKLMTQQTSRMNSIINDLLLLSRLENEEIKPLDCVDIPRMLVHIFDDAQIYNKEYGHLIDLHIDSQKNLYGSEMYLHSALLNLVTNAIKYTPKGGEIGISWQEVKGGCLFSVTDNGIGIAAEHIERLTERFYRVDSGRSRSTGGTGLGLAIVKHVVYQHEAKLTIQSTEGKGSTFNVFFPEHKVCGQTNKVIAAAERALKI